MKNTTVDNASPSVKVYPRSLYPSFLKDTKITDVASIVSPVRDADSRMATAAREGSEIVRELREKRERKRQTRDRIGAVAGPVKDASESNEHVTERSTGSIDREKMNMERRSLPAYSVKDQILTAVRENQVIIVEGETGSGKTTQIPQFVYDGIPGHGKVVVTQPRKVAAINVAARVACERGSDVGDKVGYVVRFDDKSSFNTEIKFVTDGILLREAMMDPLFDGYKAIVIDEAHERSLNTDILLGLLKRVLAKRVDLKVIVTSASLNAELFCDFFGGAPKFHIPGRTFPVHIQHLTVPPSDYIASCIRQVTTVHIQQPLPGDILVFVTGQDEIEAVCDGVRDRLDSLQCDRPLDLFPLHAQLPPSKQQLAFMPCPVGRRKVVVATNIAETSLTVEGIKYVIDSGYVKMNVYQPRARMDALVVVPISRAAANQRSGRAGRTAEGWAFRMYTQRQEVTEMLDETVPEVKRTNLTQAILQLKSLGVEDVDEFPWIESPSKQASHSSEFDLWALGALDGQTGALTKLGSSLAKYPLDPHMARLLLAGIDHGCSKEILSILAMLSAPAVFIRTPERAAEADRARSKFASPESDHITLLNVWTQWNHNRRGETWASKNFLNVRSLWIAANIRDQLQRLVKVRLKSCGSDISKIQKAICAGYFHQAARARGTKNFAGLRTNVVAKLHPTSVLAGVDIQPDYIVYHDLILTSEPYMAIVTAVEAKWLLEDGSLFYSSEINATETVTDRSQNNLAKDENHVTGTRAGKRPMFRRKSAGASSVKKTRLFRGA